MLISKNSSQKLFSPKIPPKKILKNISPKNSSQKISSKKILQKKFLQKNPPKKYPKNSRKNPKKFQTISLKIPKILKISDSLHRTWRPKTLSGFFFDSTSFKRLGQKSLNYFVCFLVETKIPKGHFEIN